MILPIVGYGDPVLRKVGEEIGPDYPDLKDLISNMFETMDGAYGVGLAAPQVGLPIRLFVVDCTPFSEYDNITEEEKAFLSGFRKAFVNAKITSRDGEEWAFNEGCLSIPDVNEDVYRKERITIEYFDENFVKYVEEFDGLAARVIQHEYDHIEGILFTDYLSTFKKKLNSRKLKNILEGKIVPGYRMRFAPVKKGR